MCLTKVGYDTPGLLMGKALITNLSLVPSKLIPLLKI